MQCTSCFCHSSVVSPLSEWLILSTRIGLQLQFDWPRQVPLLRSYNVSMLTAHCVQAPLWPLPSLPQNLSNGQSVGHARIGWTGANQISPRSKLLLRLLLLQCLIVVYAHRPTRLRLTTAKAVSRPVTPVVSAPINPERSDGTHHMHIIVTFAGLTYLTLFLSARFKLFIPMGRRHTHALLILVAFAPMVIAGFVGGTRVSDFRHHGLDVLAGSALGVIVAVIVYRHWHPWVTDRSAAIPWDVLRMNEIEEQVPYEVLPIVHPKEGSQYTNHQGVIRA